MATVYLSPSGNDANTYAQAQNPATPWATIAKVNTGAATGDTASLADGTYTFANITWGINATLQAAHTGLAIIDGASGDVRWLLDSTALRSLTMTGLVFQNINNATKSTFKFGAGASQVITFNNCTFKPTIYYLGAFDESLVSFQTAGITPTINFTSCIFDDIKANTHNTGFEGMLVGNTAATVINIIGCTFSFITTAVGSYVPNILYVNGITITAVIKNTIIRGNGTSTLNYAEGFGGWTVNSTATYSSFFSVTGSPAGTGVITSDPLLVDAANANFKLRPTSPCLGTGTLA